MAKGKKILLPSYRTGTIYAPNSSVMKSYVQYNQLIIQLYQEGHSINEIADVLGCSNSTVRLKLVESGVTCRDRIAALRLAKSKQRTYELDDNLFHSIDTEHKAYWLGFLTADGNVDRYARVSVNLQRRDREHLSCLRSFLKSSHPIDDYSVAHHEACRLRWSSQKMVEDLAAAGIGPRKTSTIRLCRNVPNNLFRHYVRGVFDGDGTWTIPKERGDLRWSVVGNRDFLLDLQPQMIKMCNLRQTKLMKCQTSTVAARLVWGGSQQSIRIANWMYADATVFLKRKFYAVYNYVNEYYPSLVNSLSKQVSSPNS